jgi:hypothetical protein
MIADGAASPLTNRGCQTGPVPFLPPPATACWQHTPARSGFEVAYFQAHQGGWLIDGTTAAVEDGQTWVVTYHIVLDAAWTTRSATIRARTADPGRGSADEGGRQRYDYAAPVFDFTSCLVYDESGLVVDYPGIARRAG